MTEKQNVAMWTKTLGAVGFVTWLLGIVVHGWMGYPSMMGMMFEGRVVGWSMMTAIYSLPILVLGGAFYGWLFATSWNWIAKNK